MSSLGESLDGIAEELLLKGEGQPEIAGVACNLCDWNAEVPWALRDRLDGLTDEHLADKHPDIVIEPDNDDDE